MKFTLHLIAFLLAVAIRFATGQTQVGTIKIDGNDLPIYINQSQVDEIVKKIKSQPAETVLPIVVDPPTNTNATKISGYHYDDTNGFVIGFEIKGKRPTEISWNGTSYLPFSVAHQKANTTTTYWLKSDGIITKIKVITKASTSTPTIEGTITPDNEPVTTPPITIVEPPTTSADFNPMPIGIPIEIQKGKVNFQVSSHSFGQNGAINSMHTILTKNGKTIFEVNNQDNQLLPGGHPSNNHMIGYNIVIPAGTLDVFYKNSTLRNQKIMFGIGEIHNNESYLFYKDPTQSIFHQALSAGESLKTTIQLKEADEFGNPAAFAENTLHKQININFYKNGKIDPAQKQIAYWRTGEWYDLTNLFQQINSTYIITVRSLANPTDNITLEIKVGGFGATGTIKVIEANGYQITETGCKISQYVFNHNYFEFGKQQYNIREGYREVPYKMFNNYTD